MTTAEIAAGRITTSRERITEAGLGASAARVAPAGTVLVAMYGQGKTRGKAAVLEIEAAMNQACAAIEVGAELSSDYLLHYLTFRYRDIRALSNAGSQENLSGEIVKSIPVVLPGRAEQDRIASALNDVDALVDTIERLIVKRQAIRQGMVQRLLSGMTRLPGFSGGWSETRLGELGSFLKGRGVRRDDVVPTGVPCIRYGELYTAFHDYTSTPKSYVTPDVAATALPLQLGDVMFAGSGETRTEIGKCVAYLGPTPAVAGGDIIVLRPNGARVSSVYLSLVANTPGVADAKGRAGQGDAVVHISSRELAAIPVSLPDRLEQDAIAEVIVASDHQLGLLRTQLAKARAIRLGMMQELLTGRSRLPVAKFAA